MSRLFLIVAGCLALTACGPKEKPVASLADLPAPYNAADVARGKVLWAQCRSCHTLTRDGPNGKGPNLHGIFGRKVGTSKGFKFSEPVKKAGFVWEYDHLDQWLQKPKDFIPGTKMSFKGFADAADRRDVIAYLALETSK